MTTNDFTPRKLNGQKSVFRSDFRLFNLFSLLCSFRKIFPDRGHGLLSGVDSDTFCVKF